MRKQRMKVALSLVVALAASGAWAQDYTLEWWTLDGGGEMRCIGGTYELSGSIGQPDAGAAMIGGDFELIGGFWAFSGTEPCLGDLDGDGDVDLADLAALLANYGGTSGMTYEDGDLDGDGDVDLADLAALLAVYGNPCP